MKITERQLRRIIAEALALDLEIGDVILTGKFKNKRTAVKKIGTDDLGQPTVNGIKALSFRIEKLMPKSKWSKKSLDADKTKPTELEEHPAHDFLGPSNMSPSGHSGMPGS